LQTLLVSFSVELLDSELHTGITGCILHDAHGDIHQVRNCSAVTWWESPLITKVSMAVVLLLSRA